MLEEDGLFSLIGIKTPGLSCAAELGKYMAEKLTDYIGCDRKNPAFDPIRKGITRVKDMDTESRKKLVEGNSDYGKIVCRCREITRGEVLEAIERGAMTVDGVKRRTGAGMGRCQGGYCMQSIMEILMERTGMTAAEIRKDGADTPILNDGTF